MSLKIQLPYPPSVNSIYRSVVIKGKVRVLKSKKGREYLKSVVDAVAKQGANKKLKGRLAMTVEASPPDRRRRDLDNLLKALQDGMEGAGVYENDSQIDDIWMARRPVTKGGAITVTLREIEA